MPYVSRWDTKEGDGVTLRPRGKNWSAYFDSESRGSFQERRRPQILNGSRRRRIARGSGTSVQDVNRLVKEFHAVQKVLRQMNRPGRRGRGRISLPFSLSGP